MVPWIFAVNCGIFLASVFVGCHVFASHAHDVFNAPAQIVSIRLVFIFILTAASFFLQFLSTEISSPMSPEAIVHDMVEEVVTGVVEAIMLLSFFFLLVVHVGGSDRAIELFSQFHSMRNRAPTMVVFTPPATSPSLQSKTGNEEGTDAAAQRGPVEYMQYRKVIFTFVVVRPIVSIAMVVNRYYDNWQVRLALASVNILITVSAVVAILLTIRRLFSAIDSRFNVLGKFFVVKGLLLVRSFQWAAYCLLFTDHDDLYMLRAYYTLCSVECLFFCVVFAVTFRPATFRRIESFPGMTLMGVWDVAMHPIPAPRDVDDGLKNPARMQCVEV
ncbi:hypothetical protein H310_09099 [Aphanomyces invadans]|uniref:THH1/TOM1/TOM3 domain-containing protein n=1 Tax=Aphanomyces invadans TaxID=157072 RepID=A0A024TVS8_9STRA|nr:hypothetical protein H310_09099 [Aphanomyces invadans]ETV97731.1 hypothetical protein H310_09099 [Aphanomyces invadans]|eukprot:XP_008873292.1 hypothetical protein H310_09099 [Aphanomyces invadans]